MSPLQPMFVGRVALLVIDIQRGGALPGEISGISIMDGFACLVANAERVVGAARDAGVPVVFFQEVHRRSQVDLGRELDGVEGVHCVEGDVGTELWPTLMPQLDEALITKRRYSCFFGTELEILLRGLGVNTLVLIGGLTDVCVHYTYADAHQSDFHTRVVEDCVIGSTTARHEAALDAMEYLQSGSRRSTAEIIEGFASLAPADALV